MTELYDWAISMAAFVWSWIALIVGVALMAYAFFSIIYKALTLATDGLKRLFK